MVRGVARWTLVVVSVPVVVVAGGVLFILDQLLPRYLIAALVVAPVALVAHLGFGAPLTPFAYAVLVLGTLLAGLWENCEVGSGRALLGAVFGAKEAGGSLPAQPRGEQLERVTLVHFPWRDITRWDRGEELRREVSLKIKAEQVFVYWPEFDDPGFLVVRGEGHARRAVSYARDLAEVVARVRSGSPPDPEWFGEPISVVTGRVTADAFLLPPMSSWTEMENSELGRLHQEAHILGLMRWRAFRGQSDFPREAQVVLSEDTFEMIMDDPIARDLIRVSVPNYGEQMPVWTWWPRLISSPAEAATRRGG